MSLAPTAARGPLRLKGEVSHPRKVKFLSLALSLPRSSSAQLFFSISLLCCPGSAPTRWKVRKVNSRFTAPPPRKGESNGVEEGGEWGRLGDGGGGKRGDGDEAESTFLRKFIQIKLRAPDDSTDRGKNRKRSDAPCPYNWRRWKSAATLKTSPYRYTISSLEFRSMVELSFAVNCREKFSSAIASRYVELEAGKK